MEKSLKFLLLPVSKNLQIEIEMMKISALDLQHLCLMQLELKFFSAGKIWFRKFLLF